VQADTTSHLLDREVRSMITTQESRFNLDRTPIAESPEAAAAEETVLAVPCPEQRANNLEAQEAEFEKYRKRVRREIEDHELKLREAIVTDFLEVADNLERAIASWKEGDKHDVESVQKGVELVLRLFRSKLERYEVKAIEAKGKPFDPREHHAVSQAPATETPPGTVLHVVQKGYWMGARLLRPASVVVASAPVAMTSEAGVPDEDRGTAGESGGAWHGYQRNRR
jgi:molecular chaperone GrpE